MWLGGLIASVVADTIPCVIVGVDRSGTLTVLWPRC